MLACHCGSRGVMLTWVNHQDTTSEAGNCNMPSSCCGCGGCSGCTGCGCGCGCNAGCCGCGGLEEFGRVLLDTTQFWHLPSSTARQAAFPTSMHAEDAPARAPRVSEHVLLSHRATSRTAPVSKSLFSAFFFAFVQLSNCFHRKTSMPRVLWQQSAPHPKP